MNTPNTSLYDAAEGRGTRSVAKRDDRRGATAATDDAGARRPRTLGEGLKRPGYLVSKWPWLAIGYALIGVVLASALSSVLLVLLLLSLVPQLRALIWPALLRAEAWRLGIIDAPASEQMTPPLARMVEDGGTPTFSQFAHLALVTFVIGPLSTALAAVIPFAAFTVLFPWWLFDIAVVQSGATPQEAADVASVYDAVIAPLPTWAIAAWVIVAALVTTIVSLYLFGLWALALGKLAKTLMAPTEEQLRADVDRLESARADVLDAAALERTRIEGALHDGVQHRLVALTMKLGMAEAEDPDGPTGKLAADVHREIDEVLADLRRVIRNIQPRALSERGLRAAVADLAAGMPLPVDVDVPSARMPRHIEEAAFFIAAEALSNVAKHSGATRATVIGGIEGGLLTLTIADDGRGGAAERAADPLGSGHGLRGMRQRAAGVDGTVTVTSPDGRGTTVTLTCPAMIVQAAAASDGGAGGGAAAGGPADSAVADRAGGTIATADPTAPSPEEDSRR